MTKPVTYFVQFQPTWVIYQHILLKLSSRSFSTLSSNSATAQVTFARFIKKNYSSFGKLERGMKISNIKYLGTIYMHRHSHIYSFIHNFISPDALIRIQVKETSLQCTLPLHSRTSCFFGVCGQLVC